MCKCSAKQINMLPLSQNDKYVNYQFPDLQLAGGPTNVTSGDDDDDERLSFNMA